VTLVSYQKISLIIPLLIISISAAPASAQRRRQPSNTTPPAEQRVVLPPPIVRQEDASIESADVSITATVRAQELTFEVVPNPTVEFPGKHKRETVWDAVRENLPRAVEPGVTYRDIGIRLKIVSRFADIERIVAEALGEIPVTDEMQPPATTSPQPNTSPPASTSPPNGGRPR
jgi:hypothetical protein